MIWGRKQAEPARGAESEAIADERELLAGEGLDPADDEELDEVEDRVADDEDDEVDQPQGEELVEGEDETVDWRADGPFDIDEVDLAADAGTVQRVDLGALIVTPWPGANLTLQIDQASQQVQAVLVQWAPETAPGEAPRPSAFEVVLYAAPTSGGLADELRDDILEEALGADGTADVVTGLFGPEVRRVIPIAGPDGATGYHVSRIWFAEGPRWLLRGTLMGYAALPDGDPKLALPFIEFFRNLVVRRGSAPMAAGLVIALSLPEAG